LSFIDDIVAWFVVALNPYSKIPQSTFFTIGIALALGLTSSTAAKLLVDYNMIRNAMKEVQAWRKEIDQAKKANDQQTLSKLMKKSQAMMKLQSRASMEQFKVTAVTFVPFLLLWYLLSAVLARHIVAISPFALPLVGTQLNFISWYFLCSFAVNFPIMRLFGIGMSEN
jgi:uncharacterized membrane protein (DUF106 family)